MSGGGFVGKAKKSESSDVFFVGSLGSDLCCRCVAVWVSFCGGFSEFARLEVVLFRWGGDEGAGDDFDVNGRLFEGFGRVIWKYLRNIGKKVFYKIFYVKI